MKKSSSGSRDIKKNKKNSVDVREYLKEDQQKKQDVKIPIKQSHGKNRSGINKDQLEVNPKDLNLLFYNFNTNGEKDDSDRIIEEQEELEDDFDLGPTDCKF